jgi:hypothetical protein
MTGCAAVGLLLAVLPHLVSLAWFGSAEWLADGDEVLYLSVARAPTQGEGALRDPWAKAEEHVPTLYPWLQYVPLAWLARTLGLPLLLQGLLWRAGGGVLLGASLYCLFRALFRQLDRPVVWALGCTLIALSDGGVVGRTLVANAESIRSAAQGHADPLGDATVPQYRVVTPLTNLPVLVFLVALLANRSWRGPGALALGCVLLALCVYLYFFFWTAAVAALSLYAVLTCCWSPNGEQGRGRFREAAFVGGILAGGLLLALPQILANSQTLADPAFRAILDRTCRGQAVPGGDAVRTAYLKDRWAWGGVLLGAAAWVLTRRPELVLLGAFTLSGFALQNSALVTGLEFENYHWNYVHSPFREVLVLTCAVLLLRRAGGPARAWLWPVALLPLLFLASALFLRAHQAIRGDEPAYYRGVLADLNDLRPALAELGKDDVLAGPREDNVAFLFGEAGQLYQTNHSSHSSLIPDREVHERHALNAWLQGMEEATYRETAAADQRFQVGMTSRPEWEAGHVREQRLALFRALEAGDRTLLERFRPTHLLRRRSDPPPQRGGPWKLVGQGKTWELWRRVGE